MRSGKQLFLGFTLLLLIPLWFTFVSLAITDQQYEIMGLIAVLENPNSSYKDREAVIDRLQDIGQPAVPALIKVLKNKDTNIDHRRAAAGALGHIGPAAKEGIPTLITALWDRDSGLRYNAALALGRMGPAAKEAIPALVAAFKNDYIKEREDVATDLLQIVELEKNLSSAALKEKISLLENLRETIFKDFNESPESDDYKQKELVDKLNLMLRTVKAEYEIKPSVLRELFDEYKSKSWARAMAGYVALLVVVLPTWLLLFWLNPLWLYRINELLSPLSIKIKPLDRPLGLNQILILSPFYYCNRILDAWVQDHLSNTKANFAALKTVRDRAVHVPVPVTLNGHIMALPSPKDFCEVFRKIPFCMLIWGEGGSGKTSLACQLAHWALAGEPESALARHPMLPVLLEYDLGQHTPLEAISKQIEIMTGGEKIAPSLIDHLLRRQRLLVFVDHYSEMNLETRERLQPGYDPQLPLHAMIVTSRQKEEFRGVVTDTLNPLRIRGNRLSSFLEAYLTQLGKRELYDDTEFFAACGRLTEMVGDRNLTVLLARMFADQMIATKEDPIFEGLPKNIPDLILIYLNWINRHESDKNPGNRTVQRIAKAISWVSLEPTFRPTDANLAAIHTALADEPNLDQKLDYLSRDLGIFQIVGPSEDKVRVSLDPVAEYLAGLCLLELYGAEEAQWRAFLEAADNKEGAPKSIEGFLLALRDCCLAKGEDYNVPGFVEHELAQKAGILDSKTG